MPTKPNGSNSTRKRRRTGRVPEALTDAARGVRIQKILAAAGIASRRACEKLITDGRVRVNHEPVTALPAWVDPQIDRVEVDGRVLAAAPPQLGRVCILLHKPKNVISTMSDPEGRTTVMDLIRLPARSRKRLFPVGRLDADSTGLILLTNDGELANRLMHPRYGVAKQYRVTIAGRLGPDDLKKLTRGLYLAGGPRRPPGPPGPPGAPRNAAGSARKAAMSAIRIIAGSRDHSRGNRTHLSVTIREGQNREIRRMLARLGCDVRRLQRVAIGPLKLDGLAAGQWRRLTLTEQRSINKLVTRGSKPRS